MPDSPARTCPVCATAIPASFPEGLCPKCMLASATPVAGMKEAEGDKTIAVPAPTPSQNLRPSGVPSVETLRALFPDLDILDLLGAGGMGAVYKARQPRLNRLVALKIMVCPPGHEVDFALRFEREAQVLARLNHPHIVIIYDFGDLSPERTGADPLFYFLMEFVDGTDLGQLIKSKELKSAQALAIVPQICDALQYAHDQGITHRDVKPANILIDKRGTVKIADFGLAKMVGGDAADAMMTGLTQTGTSMGTPHYMAPEQWENPQLVDHRADIYALGVVFYEMLTGERPAGVFQPPSKKTTPPVDRKLDGVVLRAMEKDPDRRYQQAGQIGDDVTRITGANKSRPATASATATRRSLLKPLLALGTAAALGIGGWVLWPEEEERKGTAAGPPAAADPAKTAPGEPSALPQPSDLPKHEWVKVDWPGQTIFVGGKTSRKVTREEIAKESGLKLVKHDLWIGGQVPRIGKVQNGGIRLRWKRLSEERPFNVCLRGDGKANIVLLGSRATIKYGGIDKPTGSILIGGMAPVGEEMLMEFVCVGRQLIVKRDGVVQGTLELPEAAPADFLRFQGSEVIVTQAELINLDHLSEADALKVLGVDSTVPTVATAPGRAAGPPAALSSNPGRLRAAGATVNGKPHDLTKFAAYGDFVDVAGGWSRWVALQANGQTVSSDGRADFSDIAKIAANFNAEYAFITKAGKLVIPDYEKWTLPSSLERGVVDAALGMQHGIALLEGGKAVVFGARYEGAVGDPANPKQYGTPRWPVPEARALEKVQAVAATVTHAATLHEDGTLSLWGWEGPLKWQADSRQKPLRQLRSTEDGFWALDEAGQLWHLPMPRNPAPGQPVHVTGKPTLSQADVTHMRSRCWRRKSGQWVAHINTPEGMDLMKAAGISESTAFYLDGGIFDGKPSASLLWIEPVAAQPTLNGPSALPVKPGRLRGAGFHLDGKPLDLKNAEGITDFVQAILTDKSWVGLRASGEQVTPEGGWGQKNIARLLPAWFNSYGTIDREGRLSIWREATAGIKAIPEDVQRIGVVDACWEGGQAIALLKDGTVRVWGEHYTRDHEGPQWPAPPTEALQNVRKIAITHWRAATLRHDGKWFVWGGHGGVSGPFDLKPFANWGEITDIQTGYEPFRVLTRKGEVYNLGGSRPLSGGRVAEGIAAIDDNLLLPQGASVWTWDAKSRASAQAEVDALLQQIGNRPRDAFDLRTLGENDASKVAAVWIEPVAEGGAISPSPSPPISPSPATPPPFTDREAAEWVLGLGHDACNVKVLKGGKTIEVRKLADLPAEPFVIGELRVNLSLNNSTELWEKVTDAHVMRLTGLKAVKIVEIRGKVTGASLKVMAHHPGLESLLFEGLNLRADDMSHLRASSVQTLLLPMLHVADPEGLAVLATMPNLRSLQLNESFDPALAAALPKLPKLEILRANTSATLTDEVLPLLAERFPALTVLQLWGSQNLKGTTLGSLMALNSLTTLGLTACPVNDEGLAQIAGMPQLLTLDLGQSRITDACLPTLKSFPKLESLQIYQTELTDAALLELASIPTLKKVTVTTTNPDTKRTSGFTAAGIAALQKLRPDVQVVR